MCRSLRFLLLVVVFAPCTNAGLMVFTDRASWRTAAGGGIGNFSEDFNTITSDLDYSSVGSAQTVGFLTFDATSINTSWAKIDAPAFQEFNPGGDYDIDGTTFAMIRGADDGTTVTFSEGMLAVGFDVFTSSWNDHGDPWNAITSAGDTFALPDMDDTIEFVGIVSTVPITSIETVVPGGVVSRIRGTDNWEAFAAVPEPSSAMLLACAACFGVARRKRRRPPLTTS